MWHTMEITGLCDTHSEKTGLCDTHSEKTGLCDTHLQKTGLCDTHSKKTGLCDTYSEKTGLCDTHSENTGLCDTHLEKARLCDTHSEKARLCDTHLEKIRLCDTRRLENVNILAKPLNHRLKRWPDVLLWYNNHKKSLTFNILSTEKIMRQGLQAKQIDELFRSIFGQILSYLSNVLCFLGKNLSSLVHTT